MGWSEIEIQESSFRKKKGRKIQESTNLTRHRWNFYNSSSDSAPTTNGPTSDRSPRIKSWVLIGCKRWTADTLSTQAPATANSLNQQYSALKPHYLSASNGALHLNFRVLRLEIVKVERMVARRGKKPRIAAAEEADPVENDPMLPAVVKLQQIQEELEKVVLFAFWIVWFYFVVGVDDFG